MFHIIWPFCDSKYKVLIRQVMSLENHEPQINTFHFVQYVVPPQGESSHKLTYVNHRDKALIKTHAESILTN